MCKTIPLILWLYSCDFFLATTFYVFHDFVPVTLFPPIAIIPLSDDEKSHAKAMFTRSFSWNGVSQYVHSHVTQMYKLCVICFRRRRIGKWTFWNRTIWKYVCWVPLSLFYYFITLSILIMEWVLFDLTVILAASLKCYSYDNAPIYLWCIRITWNVIVCLNFM